MIKVDVENKVFELTGDHLTQLVELEYAIADLYITLHIEKGYSKEIVDDVFEECVRKGVLRAKEVIEEVKDE